MTDRQRQILSMLVQMDKQFGKGAVLMLGAGPATELALVGRGLTGDLLAELIRGELARRR